MDYNNKPFKVEIKCFVCDAPARALLKGISGHTGYHSCERCVVVGTRCQNRTVFNLPVVEECRTDEKFSQLEYYGNHQRVRSPLLDIVINCIGQFPLDYMHLVCLGVANPIPGGREGGGGLFAPPPRVFFLRLLFNR